MANRCQHRYLLKKGRRIVYVGITCSPGRREAENRRAGKDFDHMVVIGRSVSKKSAHRWEWARIAMYQRGHRGYGSMYNTYCLT